MLGNQLCNIKGTIGTDKHNQDKEAFREFAEPDGDDSENGFCKSEACSWVCPVGVLRGRHREIPFRGSGASRDYTRRTNLQRCAQGPLACILRIRATSGEQANSEFWTSIDSNQLARWHWKKKRTKAKRSFSACGKIIFRLEQMPRLGL